MSSRGVQDRRVAAHILYFDLQCIFYDMLGSLWLLLFWFPSLCFPFRCSCNFFSSFWTVFSAFLPQCLLSFLFLLLFFFLISSSSSSSFHHHCHLYTPTPSSWALYFRLSSSLAFLHNVFLLSSPVTPCFCYIHFLHELAWHLFTFPLPPTIDPHYSCVPLMYNMSQLWGLFSVTHSQWTWSDITFFSLFF